MFVISTKTGQLGNQLILFGNLIAYAVENNLTVAHFTFGEYARFFKTTSLDLFCRYPSKSSYFSNSLVMRKCLSLTTCGLTKSLDSGKLRFFNSSRLKVVKSSSLSTKVGGQSFDLSRENFVQDLNKNSVIFFDGPLFRDWESFRKHALLIREYFTLLDVYQYQINKLLDEITKNCDLIIGVHIRQGDYINFCQGKFFYKIEDYLKVMERTLGLFPNKKVSFLVSSDARLKKENFSAFDCFFANGHIVEDMYSLAQCDYIIGPPSTYSGWASFYREVPRYQIEDITKFPTINDFKIACSKEEQEQYNQSNRL